MSACLAQQEPLKVAFLGPEGTFTQAAVLKHFGSSVRALPLPAIDEVFHEVEGGVADFGVVPIENSSEGTVNHTLDMFLTSALKICGEVELRINHHLMGRMSGTRASSASARMRRPWRNAAVWLDDQLPDVERIGVQQRRGRAARARRARHGGNRQPRGRRNLRAQPAGERNRGPRRTTPRASWWWAGNIRLSARAAPIAPRCCCRPAIPTTRARCLNCSSPWRKHKVNMTRIESRPSRKRKWDYVFFIDIEGHVSDPPVAKALAQLEARLLVQGPGLVSASRPLMLQYEARPARRVSGVVEVPGDKSISHRALMLSGIAEGMSEVRGFLASEDCLATLAAVRCLGVHIERLSPTHVVVRPGPARPAAARQPLDMGNAGTAMRLFTGLWRRSLRFAA
jgi:chorismate mutase/prephenate dehydratase